MATLKFDKSGLSGDQLEAVEKLEKTVKIEGDLTKEQVAGIVAEQIKEAGFNKETIEVLVKQLDADNPEGVNTALKAIGQRLDDFIAAGQKQQTQAKTFNDNLTDLVGENLEAIKEAAKKGGETRIAEMKAVGDMSVGANFTNSLPYLNDVRNNLQETPYNRVFLSDVILQGTTDKPWVTYPYENGGEGGAAMWTNHATDKAQMDFDLTSKSVYVHWNAGHVIIEREFLDDVPFLNSWLRAKMLLSLKNSRENFVLNGVTDADSAKSVDGLLDVATPYTITSGLVDNPVNRIVDSGYGQIIADTKGWYAPTHTVLTPRQSVRIGLNQASGSGEYDLPAGSVGFVNGRLNVGGLEVVRTHDTQNFGENDFLTLDRNAAMLVRRMNPELVVIVDSALAKRNKIMLRIEERITLLTFNAKAIVKGNLTTPTT